MTIMLVGGGSGGHITPLLAVAHSIKSINESHTVVGVCDKGSNFAQLYLNNDDIDDLFYVTAGKYRRYAGRSMLQSLLDVETNLLNIRDIFKTVAGYREAKSLLKRIRPDAILIKGGFVGVPVGLAAARLGIPFVTHDSDSTPGLANRIIARWAELNITGMPSTLYDYPKEKMRFVGIPLSTKFKRITSKLQAEYRSNINIPRDAKVLAVVGGSLGGQSLNEMVVSISKDLVVDDDFYILHVAGEGNQKETQLLYEQKLGVDGTSKIKVYGFVDDVHMIQGAADVVITRAGATQTAELALQGLPIIIVPANLAGGHQGKNADFYESSNAAVVMRTGQGDELLRSIHDIIYSEDVAKNISNNILKLARPHAAKDMAEIAISVASKANRQIDQKI